MIAFIDERIKHVGVSKLRQLNSDDIRKMGETIFVLQDGDEPLGVLVGYELFLRMQEPQVERGRKT